MLARARLLANTEDRLNKKKPTTFQPFCHSCGASLTEQQLQVPLAVVVVAAQTGEKAPFATYKVEGVHQAGAT